MDVNKHNIIHIVDITIVDIIVGIVSELRLAPHTNYKLSPVHHSSFYLQLLNKIQ